VLSKRPLPHARNSDLLLPEFVGAETKVAVENHFHNRTPRQNRLRPFIVQDCGESHASSGPGPDAAARVTRRRSGDSTNTCADSATGGDGSSVAGAIALTGYFTLPGIHLAARAGIGGNQGGGYA
jgi:hypothetical protein